MLRDLTNTLPSSSRGKASIQYDEDALPMGPEQAKIELDAIEMRLNQVFNGMRAWSARTGKSIPELEEKVSDSRDFLKRCVTIQQQATQSGNVNVSPRPDVQQQQQASYPLIVTSSDNTSSYPDIFAAPRENVTAAPAAQPSRGSRGSLHGTTKGEGAAKWLPRHDCCVAVVEFKRQRMKRCECPNMIAPGKYVLVEGDRGYDCGLVIQCAEFNSALGIFDEETQQTIDDEPVDIFRVKDGRLGQVIREATEQEVEQLYSEQASKERVALSTCRELVESLKLPMDVVDCEYQFDGNKISFYFEADHTIDFRALTTQLFRIFNARIWLENVNNSVKNTVPKGAISRNDKVSFEEVGLRLPTTF